MSRGNIKLDGGPRRGAGTISSAIFNAACDRFLQSRGQEPNEHGGLGSVMRRDIRLRNLAIAAQRQAQLRKDRAEAAALEIEQGCR